MSATSLFPETSISLSAVHLPSQSKVKQMGSMSIAHWLIVVVVVVLLFGRNKISGLMGDVAEGIKSFKKGMQEDEPAAAKPKEDESGQRIAASMLPVPASTQVDNKA